MNTDPPDDRCGFTFESSEVADQSIIGGTEGWYQDKRVGSCWRKVWQDNRCIWHADIDDKPIEELQDSLDDQTKVLQGAILRGIEINEELSFKGILLTGANFERADLRGTDLSEADLRFAELSHAYLNNANLVGADLSRSNLHKTIFWHANLKDSVLRSVNWNRTDAPETNFWQANLHNAFLNRADFQKSVFDGANLSDASMQHTECVGASFETADLPSVDLEGAQLANADFSNAVLSKANLTGATISDTIVHGTDLTKADFFGLDLSSLEIDQGTSFGSTLIYEYRARDVEESAETAEEWNRDARSHHDLKTLFADNGFSAKARRHYIAQRISRRKEAAAAGDFYNAFTSWISWQGTGYGTSIRRVFRNIVGVLLLFTVIYPFLDVGTHDLWIKTPVKKLLPRFIKALPESFYFSIITFTTVGFGEIPPSSELARYFSGIEAFLGVLLMVLLGFALGNREF